jgi:hypothetical protein
MRRAHAALVMGWYLLIPRVDYEAVVDPAIATWTQNSAWDSAGECEGRRSFVMEWAGKRLAAALDHNEEGGGQELRPRHDLLALH